MKYAIGLLLMVVLVLQIVEAHRPRDNSEDNSEVSSSELDKGGKNQFKKRRKALGLRLADRLTDEERAARKTFRQARRELRRQRRKNLNGVDEEISASDARIEPSEPSDPSEEAPSGDDVETNEPPTTTEAVGTVSGGNTQQPTVTKMQDAY